MAADNKTLGRFQLTGIPAAPRGMPQIEVSFDIDANGIVNVKAKDKATGKEQKIQITSASGLSKDEVERMVREAQSHEADDQRRKEQIETRNHLDNLIYNTEKLLNENRAQIPSDEVAKIETAVASARKAMDEDNLEAMKAAHEGLTKASHKLAEIMYQKASAPGAPSPDTGAPSGKSGNDGNVIDAEFEDAN